MECQSFRKLIIQNKRRQFQLDGRYCFKYFDDKRCAIEVLKKRSFSFASDIWAFGVVLFEIYSLGEIPFGSLVSSEVVEQVTQGKRLNKPYLCPDAIWDLAIQ